MHTFALRAALFALFVGTVSVLGIASASATADAAPAIPVAAAPAAATVTTALVRGDETAHTVGDTDSGGSVARTPARTAGHDFGGEIASALALLTVGAVALLLRRRERLNG